MTPDELRALADALEPMAKAPRFEDFDVPAFCAWVRAQADAQPVPDVPAGWKLVPVEPTPEMLDEGCDVDARAEVIKKYAAMPVIRNPENCCSCGEVLAVQYRAMLAAAPAVPQAEPKREPLSEEQMRAVLITEARRIAAQAGEKDLDSLTVDEEMLAQVMLAGRAVERAHGIGGSDAE